MPKKKHQCIVEDNFKVGFKIDTKKKKKKKKNG